MFGTTWHKVVLLDLPGGDAELTQAPVNVVRLIPNALIIPAVFQPWVLQVLSRSVIHVLSAGSMGRVAPSRSPPRGVGYPFQFRPPQIYPSAWNSLEEHRETPRSSNSPKTKWPAFSDAGQLSSILVMPWPGFEPGCLAALPPQDSVSTSFTTRAGPPT